VSSHADTYHSQLQDLLNHEHNLHYLCIHHDASLPIQMSLFKYANTSVRQLNLTDYNRYYNEEECIKLSHSPLCIQCELLSIMVTNRENKPLTLSYLMALSGAERARRYREKKKSAGLHKLIKQRDRELNLRKFRSKSKSNPARPSPPVSSFSTKQSKSKALNRVLNALPVNKDKQFELIKEIAVGLNIVKLQKQFERNQQSLSTDIKKTTSYNLCLCVHHENISLLLQALDKHVRGIKSIDLNSFIKLLVCDDSQELCMFSNCNLYSNNFKMKIQDEIIDSSVIIEWSLWSTSKEGKSSLV
ncbi:unnamed protein product, partial [Rotaria sp. Silwood1]